jgi:hypothetical protein
LELPKEGARPAITKFLEESVVLKLRFISRAFNRACSSGHITSSVAETMNSGIKANVSWRNMRLIEILEVFSERERMMNANHQ